MIVSRKLLELVGVASFIFFCFATIASAQQPKLASATGTVKGVTVDFLGPRVPNVNMIFEGAQESRKVVSNETGEFEIELPAGEYRVTVTQLGIFDPFKPKKLKVKAGKVKKFDVVLKYDIKKYPPVFDFVTAMPPDVRRWLCPAVSGLLELGLRPRGAAPLINWQLDGRA
jgi:hypothetical protein